MLGVSCGYRVVTMVSGAILRVYSQALRGVHHAVALVSPAYPEPGEWSMMLSHLGPLPVCVTYHVDLEREHHHGVDLHLDRQHLQAQQDHTHAVLVLPHTDTDTDRG